MSLNVTTKKGVPSLKHCSIIIHALVFFLDAFSHLGKRVSSSVRQSFGPSVRPSIDSSVTRVEFQKSGFSVLVLTKELKENETADNERMSTRVDRQDTCDV